MSINTYLDELSSKLVIKDDEKARKLQEYIADTMYQALLKSGFSKDEILTIIDEMYEEV